MELAAVVPCFALVDVPAAHDARGTCNVDNVCAQECANNVLVRSRSKAIAGPQSAIAVLVYANERCSIIRQ